MSGIWESRDSSPIYPIFEKDLILSASILIKWDELPEPNEETGAKQSFLMIMKRLYLKPCKDKDCQESEGLKNHAKTGRPLGDKRFIDKLEQITGRTLRKRKPGRPKKKREIKK